MVSMISPSLTTPMKSAGFVLLALLLPACGAQGEAEDSPPGNAGAAAHAPDRRPTSPARAGEETGDPSLEASGEDRNPPGTESPRPSQEQLPPPGHAWVIFDGDTVQAEVARSPEERERGLMYRTELPEGRGMLFIFPDSRIRSFWMSNTVIPLDIAYLDENLQIVDIQTMEPESLDPHESARPAMFALEVPAGWFREEGIASGARASIVFGPGG